MIALPPAELGTYIHRVRDSMVILDSDLAGLYGVTTSALNQALSRNRARFPEDFAFRLTAKEWCDLKSQIVISSGHGGRRLAPIAFTEHGVAMLAALLKSERAIAVSIQIVREFVRMRREVLVYGDLAKRLDKLEASVGEEIGDLWSVIRLMLEAPEKPKRRIGLRQRDHRG